MTFLLTNAKYSEVFHHIPHIFCLFLVFNFLRFKHSFQFLKFKNDYNTTVAL